MQRIALVFVTAVSAVCLAEKPSVLIIGDSISLGYTPHVIRIMKEEADVQHHQGNAEHTGTGLQKIESWLGHTDWDVIHFNWGLWDLCYRHPDSKVQGRRDKLRGTLTTSLEQYERNLDQLVGRLRQTNAKLIWGNTTVVPEGEAGRKLNDDLVYNQAAERVMKKHAVPINDLNQLTRSFSHELFTKPGDVHFKTEGYEKLAGQVANKIRAALQGKQKRAVSRVLFGSCIKEYDPVPIFDAIVADQPDLFIFLGDNIYADTEDMSVMKAKYQKLADMPGFQALKSTCPILATWDDHDYGVNDGGLEYSKRKESRDVFLNFWRPDEPPLTHEGIYDAKIYGPEGQRVQVILLDTRYFRSPLKRGEKRTGGSWIPDPNPSKTILGDGQWKWLEEQLLQPAEVRIIASSIQFIAEDAGQETWSNLPVERQRMLSLLKETNAGGVVFVSGDRHWSELSVVENELEYPLFELTSSSLNQVHRRGTPTENRFRHLPRTIHDANYGVLEIGWEGKTPVSTLKIKGKDGTVQLKHTI